jgi:hypothetical protein
VKSSGISCYSSISDGADTLYVSGATCALCTYYASKAKDGIPQCVECPLARARDGVPCDERRGDESFSPYYAFIGAGDPEPMIEWLKKTKEAT